jgi:hypothetical protein
MKTKIGTILFLLFSVVIFINAQQDYSKIIGTWKLVSYKYGDNETKQTPDSIQKIKLITQTTFTWVKYSVKDKIIKNSAGGTYIWKEDNYIENLDFGLNMSGFIDKMQIYKIKIDDNSMQISGKLSNNLAIEEIWKKVETLR